MLQKQVGIKMQVARPKQIITVSPFDQHELLLKQHFGNMTYKNALLLIGWLTLPWQRSLNSQNIKHLLRWWEAIAHAH